MPHDGQDRTAPAPLMDDLQTRVAALQAPLDALLATATDRVRAMVSAGGKVSGGLIDANQRAAHGLAWLATYVEAIRQMSAWAARLSDTGAFGEIEALLLQIGAGEYLAQILGGIPMNQGEILRPSDIGLAAGDLAPLADQPVLSGNSPAARARLVALMRQNHGRATFGATGLDEELEMIRDQFRRFADEKVAPFAHDWHLKDDFIPMEIIEDLADMGVFGLTIPENLGGLGLSKASMVVVSEELSRGYIGVGSLGTRSEIAAELILAGGTDAQKSEWLPKIASAEILPTAVFTEPNTGSDLGSLRTRAVKVGDDYEVTGNKTWIT
ncbi:MAG: acyl-CoA dehydrogenase, partial [Rhodobacteraceae bacterium]|nr:acyl-CoA dehydrogenase [Paracoccaceae bacterium]